MALLSAGCGGTAQKSPSGNIRAEVFAGKEGLYYTVTHDGRTVIDTSAMGVTVDGTELVPRCGPAPGRHAENRRDLLRHGTQSRIGGAVQRIPLRRDAPSFGL